MANSTKITDLDDDCLEHIFKHLKVIDLVSVADSSKRFKQAVELAYASKYGKIKVNVRIWYWGSSCREFPDGIDVHGFLTSLRLVRCFGRFIRSLGIWYEHGPSQKNLNHLEQYVNEYGADSLEKIQLIDARKIPIEHFKKPFKKVETVEFSCCALDSTVADFNKWFPSMRELEFDSCSTQNPSCIEQHFPNLKKLIIGTIREPPEKVSFNRSNTVEALRLNPQLEWLSLKGKSINAAFIHSISEHLQHIEILSIKCEEFFKTTAGVIHFRNVKDFSLYLGEIGSMPQLPLSFAQIQTLSIYAEEEYKSNVEFLELVRRHRSSLTEVVINSAYDDDEDPLENMDKRELATAMEFLIVVDLADTVFSVDEVVEFLHICKMLKRFHFQLNPIESKNVLLQRISNEWRLSTEESSDSSDYEDQHILLER